jgi:uncharacterized membrane protein YheB (UPF0754 family)
VQVLPLLRYTGQIGWQGIVPSRAAKMASLAVDKGLAKLGSIGDFYRELEPERIAEHLAASVDGQLDAMVDTIMRAEDPQLWTDLPPVLKDAVFTRVRQQLPGLVQTLTARIGDNIDQLIDAKLMVITQLRKRRDLLNEIFQGLGSKELRFIQNFGYYLGVPLGVVLFVVLHYYPAAWVLPVGGAVIGWTVNYVGLTMIFEPVFPKAYIPWRQGLFIKRQHEVTDGYAELISRHVITLENVGHELLHGPRADRTRRLLTDTLRPAVDQAVGPARVAVQAALGPRQYERIRAALVREAAGMAPAAFSDRGFNRRQARRIHDFIARQMRQMGPDDFVQMLRSAIKQDEWLLFVHGGALGVAAGHPAYARMLAEITPDEARILRLLYEAGPQPSLDVRTNRPLGIGSELVAGGLNMIAEYAGLRRMDRIDPYLTNLHRQGLIIFSKDKVDDPDRYQLIEAQPQVSDALSRAGHFPRIIYRSIRLTTFGRDFCRACLPV